MKPHPALTVLILLPPWLPAVSGLAQNTVRAQNSEQPTLRISSGLVLLDVEALDRTDSRPVSTLTRDDFRVFDNGHSVAIKTFDSGVAARPLALWFVVQCNMRGWETRGSGLFSGQIQRFQPALEHLDKRDRVAVAHWCDDGAANVDLPPTGNIAQVIPTLEQALVPRPDTPSHDRSGELALEKALQLIVDTTRSMPSEHVPVIVFLYGDYSAMPKSEANQFIGELLATSAIAFGLKDRRSPRYFAFGLSGEQGSVADYIAAQTGGEYFWATPETYASELKTILEQLHARYELGFKPAALDGKRHKLLLKLAVHAGNRGGGVRLRYRAAYIPLPTTVE